MYIHSFKLVIIYNLKFERSSFIHFQVISHTPYVRLFDSIFLENDYYTMARNNIVGGESIRGNESRKMYYFNC